MRNTSCSGDRPPGGQRGPYTGRGEGPATRGRSTLTVGPKPERGFRTGRPEMHIIPGPRYVAVGYDGSPNSTAALRRAAVEAERRHARLDVIKVIPREGGLRRTPSDWLRLRKEVARLLPRLQHVSTRLRIGRGETSSELCRMADRAELLVIGTRVK